MLRTMNQHPSDGQADSAAIIILPSCHAAKAVFPPGCPVLHYEQDAIPPVRLGTVESVLIDMASYTSPRRYEISVQGSLMGEAGSAKVRIVVPERSLRYADKCPVLVSPSSFVVPLAVKVEDDERDGGWLKGTVLSSYEKPDKTCQYSVTLLIGGQEIIQHYVPMDCVKFRPCSDQGPPPDPKSGVDETPKLCGNDAANVVNISPPKIKEDPESVGSYSEVKGMQTSISRGEPTETSKQSDLSLQISKSGGNGVTSETVETKSKKSRVDGVHSQNLCGSSKSHRNDSRKGHASHPGFETKELSKVDGLHLAAKMDSDTSKELHSENPSVSESNKGSGTTSARFTGEREKPQDREMNSPRGAASDSEKPGADRTEIRDRLVIPKWLDTEGTRGRLIGARGSWHKVLQDRTQCKISLGGSCTNGFYFNISGKCEETVERGKRIISQLLVKCAEGHMSLKIIDDCVQRNAIPDTLSTAAYLPRKMATKDCLYGELQTARRESPRQASKMGLSSPFPSRAAPPIRPRYDRNEQTIVSTHQKVCPNDRRGDINALPSHVPQGSSLLFGNETFRKRKPVQELYPVQEANDSSHLSGAGGCVLKERIDVPRWFDSTRVRGSLIGVKGVTHRRLVEESRCKIYLHGFGAEGVYIILSGRREHIDSAKAMIFDILRSSVEGPVDARMVDDLALACNLRRDCEGRHQEVLSSARLSPSRKTVRTGDGRDNYNQKSPESAGLLNNDPAGSRLHSAGGPAKRRRLDVTEELEGRAVHHDVGAGHSFNRRINLPGWLDGHRFRDFLLENRGARHKSLQRETNCKITISACDMSCDESLHVLIGGTDFSNVEKAAVTIEDLVLDSVNDLQRGRLLYDLAINNGGSGQGKGGGAAVYQRSPFDAKEKVWMCVVNLPITENAAGRILGPRGKFVQNIQDRTRCRVIIYGRTLPGPYALVVGSNEASVENAVEVVRMIVHGMRYDDALARMSL